MTEYILFSESPEETFIIGKAIGETAKSGDIFALIGELGDGKTVLVKGIAKGLGTDEEPNSPTFVTMNVYEGLKTLYHFDLYRISDISDLDIIGYKDYFFSDGVCALEWADKIFDELPKDTVIIEISNFENSDENSFNRRILKIKGNEKWVSLFKNMVEQALQA